MPKCYRLKLPFCRSEADNMSEAASYAGGRGPELGRICHSKSWFPGASPQDKVLGRATDPSSAQGYGTGPTAHSLSGYFLALGRKEKASTSSQYAQILPALGSISRPQRHKKRIEMF